MTTQNEKKRKYIVLDCGSVFLADTMEYVGKSFDMQEELDKDECESDEE